MSRLALGHSLVGERVGPLAALDVYKETTAANADFKKVYDHTVAFRNDQYLWWQVAEYTFDTYMIRARSKT